MIYEFLKNEKLFFCHWICKNTDKLVLLSKVIFLLIWHVRNEMSWEKNYQMRYWTNLSWKFGWTILSILKLLYSQSFNLNTIISHTILFNSFWRTTIVPHRHQCRWHGLRHNSKTKHKYLHDNHKSNKKEYYLYLKNHQPKFQNLHNNS